MHTSKKKKFEQVDMRDTFPCKRVAEHEVFMSFHTDEHAQHFYDFWYDVGSYLFQEYLDSIKTYATNDS